MTTAIGKITYTTTNVDMEAFHREFDRALASVRGRFGAFHPLVIGGERIEVRPNAIVDRSPIDTRIVLAMFSAGTAEHVDRAVAAAKKAQVAWGRMPWRERLAWGRCCIRRSRKS